MKIILTGSLGNISKPLTQLLLQEGHSVTVISSKAERQKDIEALGAKAAIGTIQDVDFLSATFKGADIVYTMETLDHSSFFDATINVIETISQIAKNYKQAIKHSGVKKVVHLSSIGAHTDKGNGILVMHYNAEKIMNELPAEVAIKFMRPAGFYTNIFREMQSIRMKGVIISNFGGDTKEPWVSPLDIASIIAEEMEKPFGGRTIKYIASDEVSTNEIATVLGKAIGNPELKWMVITDEQLLNGMLGAGINPQITNGFVEMQAAQKSGLLYEDYYKYKPTLGKVKLTNFAKEFAQVYNH